MRDALHPPKARIPRTTRRVQHLAPSLRASRRKRRSLRPKAPPAWGLSLTGVWLLCSACSFNNSFQDGCFGSIHIQVPPHPATAKHTQSSAKAAPSPQPPTPRQERRDAAPTRRDTLIAVAQQPASLELPDDTAPAPADILHAHRPRTAPQDALASARSETATPASAKIVAPAAPSVPSVTAAPFVPSAPSAPSGTSAPSAPSGTSAPSAPAGTSAAPWLMPSLPNLPQSANPNASSGGMAYSFGLLQRLWRAESELSRSKRWPTHTRIQTLHSDAPEAIWQERPTVLRVCYDSTRTNDGWNQPHPAQNTARLDQRCQIARPLGQGKHWFVLSDTFAASATSCRLFFSPGRLAVIASCGHTLYRASIRPFASCLQQQKGCSFPHLALERLPPQSQQVVELVAQTNKPNVASP